MVKSAYICFLCFQIYIYTGFVSSFLGRTGSVLFDETFIPHNLYTVLDERSKKLVGFLQMLM